MRPFDNRSPNEVADAGVAWAFLALLYSHPMVISRSWEAPAIKTYTFDSGRLFAALLVEDLIASGEFEEVAFEPQNLEAYDLVIEGTITNIGTKVKMPFVPLPLYIGAAIASLADEEAAGIDIDLRISPPQAPPALRYGVAAGCDQSEAGCPAGKRFAETYAFALKREYQRFAVVLSSYVASRSSAFWQSVRDAAAMRYYDSLDPELRELRLDAGGPDAARADAARSLYAEKTALLEMLRIVEDAVERHWAASSHQRIRDELIASNKVAAKTYDATLRTMVLASVASAARVGVAAASDEGLASDSLKRDLERIRELARKESKRIAALRGDGPDGAPSEEVKAFAAAIESGGLRSKWLAYYRSAWPSVAEFRAKPLPNPVPPPRK